MLGIDAFDIVIATGFLPRNLQVKLLPLQRPCAVHCDFSSVRFSVPLQLSGRKESCLHYVNRSYRTENYQLVPSVKEKRPAAMQSDLNEIQVALFGSKEQQLMQLYCSRTSIMPVASTRYRWGCAMLGPHCPNFLRC